MKTGREDREKWKRRVMFGEMIDLLSYQAVLKNSLNRLLRKLDFSSKLK